MKFAAWYDNGTGWYEWLGVAYGRFPQLAAHKAALEHNVAYAYVLVTAFEGDDRGNPNYGAPVLDSYTASVVEWGGYKTAENTNLVVGAARDFLEVLDLWKLNQTSATPDAWEVPTGESLAIAALILNDAAITGARDGLLAVLASGDAHYRLIDLDALAEAIALDQVDLDALTEVVRPVQVIAPVEVENG